MFQDGINGVCMALADSVPGVSGGTVAFVLGLQKIKERRIYSEKQNNSRDKL